MTGKTLARPTARVNFCVGNEQVARVLKAVIAYEACVRNRSRSRAAYELVMEAADVDSYPDDLRDRLASLDVALRSRAAARFLEQTAIDTPTQAETPPGTTPPPAACGTPPGMGSPRMGSPPGWVPPDGFPPVGQARELAAARSAGSNIAP